MSDLPASNTYQIAGLDEQSRGFNRQATVTFLDNRYQAEFLYERVRMVGEHQNSETGAVLALIQRLQESGYRELRSRLHFRGKEYLGNQENWEDHPDPAERSFWTRLQSRVRTLFTR